MNKLLALIAGVLLAGCSVTPGIDTAEQQRAWHHHQQQLEQLDQWQLNGRIAITRGVESYTLNIRWKQKTDGYEIFLSGPMNSGKVQLVGDNAGGVVLRDAEKNVYHAEQPEQLLYQHTGVSMPVTGLRYWVLGLPQPAASSVNSSTNLQLDNKGRLRAFIQKDWQIEYDAYTQVTNWQLPESLYISNDEVEVRLVVHRWRLPS